MQNNVFSKNMLENCTISKDSNEYKEALKNGNIHTEDHENLKIVLCFFNSKIYVVDVKEIKSAH